MSRGQLLGLIALVVALAVAAFVLLDPGDDEDDGATKTSERTPTTPAPTATTDARPERRIVLRGHAPAGGVLRLQAEKGELVRIAVESDSPDEIHLHGYDVERDAGPGQAARFSLRADMEGVFELESHRAAQAGRDPLVARLVVGHRR